MRADGIFIAVEVADEAADDAELARKLTEACPVDIFAQGSDGALEIVQKNLDECVLCRLCLDAADGWGANQPVKIVKLYDAGAVLA
jgi:ferredoxin-like protein FixX